MLAGMSGPTWSLVAGKRHPQPRAAPWWLTSAPAASLAAPNLPSPGDPLGQCACQGPDPAVLLGTLQGRLCLCPSHSSPIAIQGTALSEESGRT